ncbi:MAG: hypothetical protein ACK40O_13610 [Allosphingosinicella sp.]
MTRASLYRRMEKHGL